VIRRLIARRDLVSVLPGVYAARPSPVSFEQRAWAGVLWSGGVLSHHSAARLWDLPVAASRSIHLTVAPAVRPTAAGILLHRVTLMPGSITTIGDLPVTRRSATVLDLLRSEPLLSARNLLDRAVQQGWIDARRLEAALVDQPSRTGNRQLRRLIVAIEPGADAESERVLHRLLRQAGLTGWVAQYRVRLPSGLAFVDVAFPEHRLAIEVDGRRYHDANSDAFERDRSRQNELHACGWRVLRFTWAAMRDDPAGVIRRVRELLA
jgi:very-short-patch-repair endonuclease